MRLDAEFRLVRIEGHDFEGCEAPIGDSALGTRRWESGLEIEAGDWDAHRAVLESREPFRDVVLLRHQPAGGHRYFKISGEPIVGIDGGLQGYRGVGHDITEKRLSEDRIQHLATHDALTGPEARPRPPLARPSAAAAAFAARRPRSPRRCTARRTSA